MIIDVNLQLVIDADFESDLLNRTSNKFRAMEENIGLAVRINPLPNSVSVKI